MQIEIVADVKTALGEGPVWDPVEERIYWVDGFGPRLFRATADGRELRAWELEEPIGSYALREKGGAILALKSGLHMLDFASGETQFLHAPEPDLPDNRLNDGKVDRQGRFIFGSMDQREKELAGSIYALDIDLTVRKLDTGFMVSNGPCWSPDGETFYVQDSYAGEIRAYRYDCVTGEISDRRIFARLDTASGDADGSTVDAEGCLWNAQIFDGKLVRYTPDGQVEREIDMPVKKVTSVMFGGPDLDILYVTSMGRQLLPHFPADGQMRGSLFAIKGLGIRGVPERRFAG